jgi:hypothetical protein
MNDIYSIPLYDLKDNMIDDNHNVHNITIKRLIKSELFKLKQNSSNLIRTNLISSKLINTIIELNITYHGIKEIDIINYVINELTLSNKLTLFNEALNDIIFYDEDGNINLHCIEGRVARYLQCLNINFIPFWYIKDQITNIIIKIIKTFDISLINISLVDIIYNLNNYNLNNYNLNNLIKQNLQRFVYKYILYISNDIKYLDLITKNELINIINTFI